jgi:hypothetical protein
VDFTDTLPTGGLPFDACFGAGKSKNRMTGFRLKRMFTR